MVYTGGTASSTGPEPATDLPAVGRYRGPASRPRGTGYASHAAPGSRSTAVALPPEAQAPILGQTVHGWNNLHVSDENVAEDFAQMAMTLHGEETLEQTVERVLEFALKAVGCSYAGIIFVHRETRVETFAATDPLVAHLDKVQFEVGEGPDIEIIEDHRGVIVDDTETDRRWPAWSKQVADAGVRSMLGTRLYTSDSTIGSLNLYDVRPGVFTSEDRDIAHIMARHAAVAMASTREQDNLWKAIDARQLIGQAQGILMERFAIDAEQAFTVLRRYSQDRNLKLNVVAQRLIETRRLPD